MTWKSSRRSFVRRALLAGGAVAASRSWVGPNLVLARNAGDKLKCVLIGCGGRGMAHLDAAIAKGGHHLFGIVDPDENKRAAVRNWVKRRGQDGEAVQGFADYRRMFEKIGKDLDAVFIATPNHHHALPALLAIQHGKHVYCEKPVCHSIAEARAMRAAAAGSKVATQMGNQGHCEDGYRRLCEYIWSGAIGRITETHSWSDRCNGGVGPRPPYQPVPSGLDWDVWIGPSPRRDYHSDLHPHSWHGWHDFGNGSIGNMGCHVLDGVYWALKLEHPDSVEMEYVRGGSDERYPVGSRLRWEFPARGDHPPVKVYWYEGLNKETQEAPFGNLRVARGDARNLPPLYAELKQRFPDEEFGSNGTLYVGEKGYIYTGTYGDRMHLVPTEKMGEVAAPPKSLPRPKDVFTDFLEACLADRRDTAVSFDYGTRLTEFALLGNLAQIAGEGRKVEWDGPGMRVKNHPELNRFVKRTYRAGWTA